MIQTIFGSPVVIVKINNFKEIFPNNLCNEIIENLTANEEIYRSLDGYSRGGKGFTANIESIVSSDKIETIDKLVESMRTIGLQYIHLFSKGNKVDLKISNTTVNINFQGCECKNHIDKQSKKGLTILFYPKVPENSANLVFIHNGVDGDWPSDCKDRDMVKLSVDEGTVIIFDNETPHAVDNHNSKEIRMSIHNEFEMIDE